MRKATLAQRDKLWEMIDQDGTPRDQVQRLIASGLFSDLLCADFNIRIDRDEFRKIIGLKPLEYHITVRYNLPLEELLRHMHTTSVNCALVGKSNLKRIQEKRNCGPTGIKMECVLFKIPHIMKTDAILALMDQQGLRPMDLRELAHFDIRFPNVAVQRGFSIIGLDTVFKWDSENAMVQVPGLADYEKEGVGLALFPIDEEWDPKEFRFLAVPQ